MNTTTASPVTIKEESKEIILDATTGQIEVRCEALQVPTHQQSIEEISRLGSDALIHNQTLAIGQCQFGACQYSVYQFFRLRYQQVGALYDRTGQMLAE
jgi:hypothetical protein